MNAAVTGLPRFDVADRVARDLVAAQTDPNEVAKAMSHLVAHPDGRAFFTFLRTVVRDGRIVIRSNRTLDYYRAILNACEQHLTPYQSDPKVMAETLGWAVRLMRYYIADPNALRQPTARAETRPPREASPPPRPVR